MNQPATEPTITAIENRVTALLAEKLANPTTAIATNKYLTGDNHLIYLTQCTVAESSIPRIRIQIFERVEGGVHEHSYALFNDRRFEATENPMIFGQAPAATEAVTTVDEPTAASILTSIETLSTDQQNLA